MPIEVYHRGECPNDVMIIGEKPGEMESKIRRPFVGPSGDELILHLSQSGRGYHPSEFYITNIDKEYIKGNPDPTAEQIDKWTPYLIDEIKRVNPVLIIAAGRYAAWWLLGGYKKYGMRIIHGKPYTGGYFADSEYMEGARCYICDGSGRLEFPDVTNPGNVITSACAKCGGKGHDLVEANNISSRANGAIGIPCYHPAAGLHNEDMKSVVWGDYRAAMELYEQIKSGHEIYIPVDDSREEYYDVSGRELADYLHGNIHDNSGVISIDTEDDGPDPWSLQVCIEDGTALMLHKEQPDFECGIKAIQRWIDAEFILLIHFSLHDNPVLRKMRLILTRAIIHDTGYMAYLLHEPQGLKALALRWCGMLMDDYLEVVGNVAYDQQLSYLRAIVDADIPKRDKVNIQLNNGIVKPYGPQSVSNKAKKILKDISDGKLDKKGNPVDPYNRWTTDSGASTEHKRYLRQIRWMVEDVHGPMPEGSLKDVYESGDEGRKEAVRYGCRDAHATFNLYWPMKSKLEELGMM